MFFALVHYFTPRIYITLCAPDGFIGFAKSLFLVEATHCKILLSVIDYSAKMMIASIGFVGLMALELVRLVK